MTPLTTVFIGNGLDPRGYRRKPGNGVFRAAARLDSYKKAQATRFADAAPPLPSRQFTRAEARRLAKEASQ